MRVVNRMLAALPALTLTAGLFLAGPARAAPEGGEDRVVLEDGRTVTGRIVGEDDDYVSIRSGGVLRAYPRARVTAIERAAPPAAEAASDEAGPQEAAGGADGAAGSQPAPAAEKGGKKKRAARAARRQAPEPLGTEAQAWLHELLNRVRSPAGADPTVRASLVAALRALGPAAAPAIREAAGDATGEAATALRELADGLARDRREPAGATTDAPAAPPAPPATDARDLVASLGLRKDQARQARDLLREHLKARREIAVEARTAGTPHADVVARLAELRTSTRTALRGLLDEEQAARFDAVADDLLRAIEERRPGDKERKRGKDAPEEPAGEPSTGQ